MEEKFQFALNTQRMRNKLVFIFGIGAWLLIAACKDNTEGSKLTDFVKDAGNRLTQKAEVSGNKVVSQFVPDKPEEGEGSDVYRFIITVQSSPEKTTDSILYFFNYKSAGYFRMVTGADTLHPVLSERMANGREDLHQFTVLFDRSGISGTSDSLEIIFLGNKLFADSLFFRYALTDIKNATKTLYGYE